MKQSTSNFNLFTKVFITVSLLVLLALAFVIALKVVVEDRIESKQALIVEVMKSGAQDSPEARNSVMRVLLEQPRYQAVAAPWIIRLSSLEFLGYMSERDNLYLRALNHLGPIEMKTFLNTTREMIDGFPESAVAKAKAQGRALPPILQVSRYQLEDIRRCRDWLNKTVRIVPKDQYSDLSPLERSINDFKLAFPAHAFEGCDL